MPVLNGVSNYLAWRWLLAKSHAFWRACINRDKGLNNYTSPLPSAVPCGFTHQPLARRRSLISCSPGLGCFPLCLCSHTRLQRGLSWRESLLMLMFSLAGGEREKRERDMDKQKQKMSTEWTVGFNWYWRGVTWLFCRGHWSASALTNAHTCTQTECCGYSSHV